MGGPNGLRSRRTVGAHVKQLSGAARVACANADTGYAVPRWLIPVLLAVATLVGIVLLFVGYAIGVHGGVCDPYNCPSETTRTAGRYLLPIGATMTALGAVTLVAWLLREHRRRSRARPAQRKPTLREW
jgi:hypothetical protein